ncbi:PAS domain-containing sensor histidine kinase [Pseudomonas sp. RW10S2]|uniref:PAS domain-containing sensor histidine kinase n=1 Tax=Pseudomonas sp. RW10S2 TaxID=459637 RepID=UPI0016441544|nr:PAS domain-containing sensor histidine kinase [Pseudomonas sp. RW10S2]MBC3466135.1 PAS domain-containing sensor histidine kinase [Pseudomonas sp. RW10S2]QXI42795.1 PAS domain-containing sensor histidine kinase [Pseudomonas wayambapalatensis]
MDDTAQLLTAAYFENAPCGLVVMAADGTIIRANQTFCDWLGYDSTLMHACSFEQLLTVAGRVFQSTHWKPLMDMQGSVAEVKVDLQHRNGTAVAMLLNGVRQASDDGVVYQLALFGISQRDRNERGVFLAMQRAEELLAQKAAAESALQRAQVELAAAYEDVQHRALLAERMVAVASHDLKNPMTAIKMATELLARDVQSDRGRRLLGSIGTSAERAQRMIVDLLDFASIKLGQGIGIRRQQVDLLKAMDQSVSELRIVFGNASIRHLSRGQGTFEVDQDRLHQMIGNLVANSAAYGDLRYPITLTTEFCGNGVVLSVHNHGPAIAEELLPKLFEPMTRGSDRQDTLRSLGLGLFIVKQIAEAHGGWATVTSDPIYGTTFIIHLPY